MPTAYEKTYGAVKFYDLGGTAIFDTEDDLGLWTTMDDEPSPKPKWIRVDVPGADGAVDLSRALAGQTTYEMREIHLGFGGKCADHATALALVHQMRRALHGARVRVETLLTAQIGGYYIADCECDGIAYASGDVEVSVTATADPFIRVGNQTLALPAGAEQTGGAQNVQDVPVGVDPAVSSLDVRLVNPQPSLVVQPSPVMCTSARLWWARGANLLDVSMWPVATSGEAYAQMDNDPQYVRLTPHSGVDGHYQLKASNQVGGWPDWPHSLPFGWLGSRLSPLVSASGQRLLAFVTGKVTHDVTVTLSALAGGTGTDSSGFVTGGATLSESATISASDSVSATLEVDLSPWAADVTAALSAIGLAASGGSANLVVRLMLTCEAGAVAWEAPYLGWADATWGSPIGSYGVDSDVLYLGPVESYVYHKVETDGLGTATGMLPVSSDWYEDVALTQTPPSDAKWLSVSFGQSGGQTGATCASGTYPTPATATGTNTTMRSTPSITSQHGAQVTIDGRTATVGSGTVALPALVIPGGTFTVGYSLFGSSPADATLTWEGGVL